MNPSVTAYDDAFRTLMIDCTPLIIPVVNEAFGEYYTGREKIFKIRNNFFRKQAQSLPKAHKTAPVGAVCRTELGSKHKKAMKSLPWRGILCYYTV